MFMFPTYHSYHLRYSGRSFIRYRSMQQIENGKVDFFKNKKMSEPITIPNAKQCQRNHKKCEKNIRLCGCTRDKFCFMCCGNYRCGRTGYTCFKCLSSGRNTMGGKKNRGNEKANFLVSGENEVSQTYRG